MNEKELKEIEEIKNSLVFICNDGSINWDKTAKECYKNRIRKIPKDAMVLTKDELAWCIRLAKAIAIVGGRDNLARDILEAIWDEWLRKMRIRRFDKT